MRVRRLRSNRSSKRWAGAILVGALVVGAFALTNSNTVPATQAGDGAGAISGYVVSAVKYNLNASNPSNIDSVTFNLDSTPVAGSTLKMQLAAAGSWYTCTNLAVAITCATTSPQATVAAATTLRVIVAQ